nr:MAG TPA_asm: hypothetical protein [Caudoviricetes sp.]
MHLTDGVVRDYRVFHFNRIKLFFDFAKASSLFAPIPLAGLVNHARPFLHSASQISSLNLSSPLQPSASTFWQVQPPI